MSTVLNANISTVPETKSSTQINGLLARTRKIWRLSEILLRAFLWTIALLGSVLLLGLLDNFLRMPGFLRLFLGVVWVAGATGSLFVWVLRPLFWRINDQATAVYLERKLDQRENLLINAVQLSQQQRSGEKSTVENINMASAGISLSMVEHVIALAAQRAGQLSLQALWDQARLKKLGIALGVASFLLALYVLLLPGYAQNAFQRFSKPLSGIPPLSKTHVFATPTGEIEVCSGDKFQVFALAHDTTNTIPSEATLIVHATDAVHRLPMVHSASAHPDLMVEAHLKEGDASHIAGFSYEFSNISVSFTFYVACGDGESLPCHVVVKPRPELQDFNVTIAPPAYTGQPATHEPSANGTIYALQGSRVTLVFCSSSALQEAKLITPATTISAAINSSEHWQVQFDVLKEFSYVLALRDNKGVDTPRAFSGQVTLRPDALPTASFENATLNIAVPPGATVPLSVRAQDDFGLKTLRLVKQQGLQQGAENSDKRDENNTFTQIKAWSYPVPGPRSVNELYPLKLNGADDPAGSVCSVYIEVTDHCPNGNRIYRSAPLVIRILTAAQSSVAANSPFASVYSKIQSLIEQQTAAHGKTVTVRTFLDEVFAKNHWSVRIKNIWDAQTQILLNAQKLLAEINGSHDDKIKSSLDKLSRDLKAVIDPPLTKAMADLKDAGALKDKKQALAVIVSEETLQREIINRLTTLLGSISVLDKDKKDPQVSDKDDQDGQRLRDKLEKEHEKIKDFIDAQKQIIKSSEELEKKKPEDLTAEDEKTLEDLARAEKDWAKYFKEQFTDLSKVPNQDFSNSKLAQEFNEVYMEIQKASEALQGKNTEIAVRNEEAGLELAKSMETNLEKWLPDTRDTQKWNMEEPKGEFDVPLADLPLELEDIIGALVDDEEKMTDDVQDTSSSWLDSLDKGAGWDAVDGNISDMSAKGVTGNRLPNQMEISGRSGEGRNGKSNGQFVQDSADGKGGQQTPSRLTQDPFEQGQVKDSSKDAQGGSTGGGKESGAAAAGLRGTPPPQTLKKMERLKDVQADIRQKAEKVSTLLKAYHLPSSDSDEAVRRMKLVEDGLKSGKGFDLRQAHSSVLDSLKEAKKVVGFQGEINKERTRDLPKNVRNQIISGMHTDIPKGYQDLTDAYYKALVEPDK